MGQSWWTRIVRWGRGVHVPGTSTKFYATWGECHDLMRFVNIAHADHNGLLLPHFLDTDMIAKDFNALCDQVGSVQTHVSELANQISCLSFVLTCRVSDHLWYD